MTAFFVFLKLQAMPSFIHILYQIYPMFRYASTRTRVTYMADPAD